jgi:hypothetical protein
VARNSGNGYLVNAVRATNVVVDSPLIDGGNTLPPDHIVIGTSAPNVTLRNVDNAYASTLSSTFAGNLTVTGTLAKSAGSFKIDDPLDPEHKQLSHSFVESPDMKNIYDGVVQLNEHGEAWVQLPEWFEALNRDFRYQLSCIGSSADVYIAREIRNNRFKIAGGKPKMRVSWQVTGVRHDAYANEHRIPVEEFKPAANGKPEGGMTGKP